MDAGVLTKLGAGGEEEAPGVQAQSPAATDAEDLFVGSSENPLAMYFDGEPNADGSEDMVEPEAGEIEKTPFKPTSDVSEDDFEASLKYRELERRLAATKSNILKIRKSKSTAGDINDRPSDELQRLRDLKASLEQRIAAVIDSSDFVKKLAGVEIPKPPVKLSDEEEEPLQEDNSWELNRLQFYAGIKK
jgi:hypothetical protein